MYILIFYKGIYTNDIRFYERFTTRTYTTLLSDL